MSTEAVPFLASAILACIAAITSYAVGKRAPDVVRKLDEKYPPETPGEPVPPHRTPDAIGKICVWAADCAQSGVALAGPPIAALLLADRGTSLLGLAYLLVGGLGALLFIWLLFADPDRYTQRVKFGLTPVAAIAIVINLLMALVVTVTA